jgi:hypothetical protein
VLTGGVGGMRGGFENFIKFEFDIFDFLCKKNDKNIGAFRCKKENSNNNL